MIAPENMNSIGIRLKNVTGLFCKRFRVLVGERYCLVTWFWSVFKTLLLGLCPGKQRKKSLQNIKRERNEAEEAQKTQLLNGSCW